MRYKLHRTLALWLGGFIALWVLAGCLLLWQASLQPPRSLLLTDAPNLALTQILEAAQTRYPEPGSWRLRLPSQPGEAIQAIFLADDLSSQAAEPIVLWLDPKTTKVLAEAQAKGLLWQGLYQFHARLLLGERGNWAAFSCGLILGNILLSGVLLWRRKTSLSLARRLHRLTGMAILPPLLLSLSSGLVLSLPGRWLSAQEPDPIAFSLPLGKSPSSADEIARRITELFPELYLRELATPQTEDAPWELAWHRPGALDVAPAWVRVWVDAQSGTIRVEEPSAAWRARLRQWAYAIHTGQIAGRLGQAALSLGGAGFLLQTALGVVLWLRRKRRLVATRSPAADRRQQAACN